MIVSTDGLSREDRQFFKKSNLHELFKRSVPNRSRFDRSFDGVRPYIRLGQKISQLNDFRHVMTVPLGGILVDFFIKQQRP